MADRLARCYVTAHGFIPEHDHTPDRGGRRSPLVLLLGLLNMMRGGSPNRSQKLIAAAGAAAIRSRL